MLQYIIQCILQYIIHLILQNIINLSTLWQSTTLCHTDNNTVSYIVLLLQLTLQYVNQLELQYITLTVYITPIISQLFTLHERNSFSIIYPYLRAWLGSIFYVATQSEMYYLT